MEGDSLARNKYPEETVQKILTAAKRLFGEKGYEHTTIADIVSATGMSKGAFYHHFKSKEDVYDRITDQYYDSKDWMRDATKFPGDTALEKMQGLFSFLLSDPEKLDLDRLGGGNSMSIANNPKVVWLSLESTIRDAAPVVERLIHEGNKDGSIHVAQPKETAEAFMMLMNMWVGIFVEDFADYQAKLNFLKIFSEALGMPIFNDKVYSVAMAYYDSVMSSFVPLDS